MLRIIEWIGYIICLGSVLVSPNNTNFFFYSDTILSKLFSSM